jgi:hypothetical protein
VLVAGVIACRTPPPPVTVDADRISIVNQTADDWRAITVRVNAYYVVEHRELRAGGRFDVPLGRLQGGFGRYFDRQREQVRSVQVTATTRDGLPIDLRWPES